MDNFCKLCGRDCYAENLCEKGQIPCIRLQVVCNLAAVYEHLPLREPGVREIPGSAGIHPWDLVTEPYAGKSLVLLDAYKSIRITD